MDPNGAARLIEAGEAILGIELGSTRIKAALIAPDGTPLASGAHGWENRFRDGVWTYDLADILDGLAACYADLIRDVRARHGVDLPVVVSDSFGRPWRWGIVDVAIGVSGLHPVEDLRGVPDADGRVMQSTVRAVADEIASAAELAFGKASGLPVALVRGARPPLGEGSIREALIPSEWDLFR